MFAITIVIIITILIIISGILIYRKQCQKKKLCVLAIFKNETLNLDVWVRHYLWQGVDTLYLIDNGSTDNPLPILQPYIDRGEVVYFFRPERHRQESHYHHVIQHANLKKMTEWLLICDLDEFVYSPSGNLASTLDDFKDKDLLYINWIMFGSDGLIDHPADIRTAIIRREPDLHVNTKYIVRIGKVKNISDIGVHTVKNDAVGRHATENEKIRLNHYPIQSWHYFKTVKMSRGDVSTEMYEKIRDEKYFKEYDQNTTFQDTTLRDLILAAKQ